MCSRSKRAIGTETRIYLVRQGLSPKSESGFFSNTSTGYKYSTYLAKSIPLTPSLEKLLALVNAYHHTEFNGILVNEYVNGSDYIGPHSDEERCLDKIGVIAVSYGASPISYSR